MEEELEDMSEKVEDDEEEREVNTVRETLVLSISSEYKFTTKYEPQWGLDSQDKRTRAQHNAITFKTPILISTPGPQVPKTEQALRKMRSRAAVLHKHPVGS